MSKLQLNKELIEELAEVLKKTDLSELEYSEGDKHIRLARQSQIMNGHYIQAPQMHAAPAHTHHAEAKEEAKPAAPQVNSEDILKSPMVGVAYHSSEPGAKPFISVGDTISKGQTVMIVEAMKVMNQIKAHKAGKIAKICVENAKPVEYDEPLVIIE